MGKKELLKGLKGIKPLRYYLYIILGLFPLDVVTILWGFILSGYQNYTRNFIPDSVRSPYVMALLYYMLVAVIMVLIYFIGLKWRWKSTIILAIYGVNFLAYKLHILYFFNLWWFIVFSTVLIFSIYLSIILLDYLFKTSKS